MILFPGVFIANPMAEPPQMLTCSDLSTCKLSNELDVSTSSFVVSPFNCINPCYLV